MKDLISVIIPTFNRSQLLGETLDSVREQTFKNWECLVIDDGSTDHTAELMEFYCMKDDRINYYVRPEGYPKGANVCRNYGLHISTGYYINFFDSDDIMFPEKLSQQVLELQSTGFNYTICQTELYDSDKKKILGLRAAGLKSTNTLDDYITKKIFWLTGAPLWKRSFLEKNKLKFNPKLFQSQDYDFHMRVLAVDSRYAVNEKPLVRMKIHESNMSNSVVDSYEKFISNINVRLYILKSHQQKLNYATVHFIYNELNSYLRTSILSFPLRLRILSFFQISRSLKYTNGSPKEKIRYLVNGLKGVLRKDTTCVTNLKLKNFVNSRMFGNSTLF